jgi:hypothetical protein
MSFMMFERVVRLDFLAVRAGMQRVLHVAEFLGQSLRNALGVARPCQKHKLDPACATKGCNALDALRQGRTSKPPPAQADRDRHGVDSLTRRVIAHFDTLER